MNTFFIISIKRKHREKRAENGRISISVIFLEFWEDDGEIRLEDERAWFLPWRRARKEIERVFLAGKNEA
jgi:hypothetical protein